MPYVSLRRAIALGYAIASIAAFTPTLARGADPILPFCTTFQQNPCPTCDGWFAALDAPNITLTSPLGGPSGPSDRYLLVEDESNASMLEGPASFHGDWTNLLSSSPCGGSLCFYVKIVEDACAGATGCCEESPPTYGGTGLNNPNIECVGFELIGIKPTLRLSGPGGDATFVSSTPFSEDTGPFPGWHRVCAPIRPADVNGSPPGNSYGSWQLTSGSWDALIADVTRVRLPVDFTSNPAEQIGYDNICVEIADCPCEVDHYKCYRAVGKTVPLVSPTLVDQFMDEQVTFVKPYQVCTPVSKNGEAINNAVTHLTCYVIKGRQRVPKVDVRMTHQFGPHNLSIRRRHTLCLPSNKAIVFPPPTTTTTHGPKFCCGGDRLCAVDTDCADLGGTCSQMAETCPIPTTTTTMP
jgi:hypothetical protein